jgi:hypothetical protein
VVAHSGNSVRARDDTCSPGEFVDEGVPCAVACWAEGHEEGWLEVEGNANRWAHATVALLVGPSCAARQKPQSKPSRG